VFACGLAGLAESSLITIPRVCRNMPAMRTHTKKHTLDYIWQVEARTYHRKSTTRHSLTCGLKLMSFMECMCVCGCVGVAAVAMLHSHFLFSVHSSRFCLLLRAVLPVVAPLPSSRASCLHLSLFIFIKDKMCHFHDRSINVALHRHCITISIALGVWVHS